jgi:hypothetical protein
MDSGYKVGQRITVARLGAVVVRAVHAFGTVDVESVATGKWYRVTGLAPATWGAAVLAAGAL